MTDGGQAPRGPRDALDAAFRTREELEQGLDHVRRSPLDAGVVEWIVRRPTAGQREVLDGAQLDRSVGLVGDDWSTRPSSRTPDGAPHPGMQLAIMNARVASLVAGPRERWRLAGDQLFVDLDLSADNLPPGTLLELGAAVVEISDALHSGCKKFAMRFGVEALKFINTGVGRALRLRGVHARVLRSGSIRVGDRCAKIAR